MSSLMTESEYLEHLGVRGMKWGVRKKRYDTIRNRKLADFSVITGAFMISKYLVSII